MRPSRGTLLALCCILTAGVAACSGTTAGDLPHGVPLDLAAIGPNGDGGPSDPGDLAGADFTGAPMDGGVAGPVHTIKLSTSLYCPKMTQTGTAQLFYASDAAVEAAYDAWLAGVKAGSAPYAAPPLDVLGARVRTGTTGNGSTVTPTQLENMKIGCTHIPSKAGPGKFETTTLTPDPAGKPVCLFEGMDWGIDFHYASASFPMRAVCLGAPTTFAWTSNFANDKFPTAVVAPAGGVGAFVSGTKTYAFGYSLGTWASGGGTVDASKSTTYNMTFTATNAMGTMSPPTFKYRFVNIGDTYNGGSGGITRHPSDNNCLIKSAGEKGNNVEGQLAVQAGQVWAIRVMLVPASDGAVGQFQWVLWGDTEFAIGGNIQPYAVISDLPCEFDQIVDGCYSDSVNISYYPGNPVYVNDLAAAKAQNKRYCGLHTDQIYYMNVRSQTQLAATPTDGCPSGSCTFGAFFQSGGP